MKKRVLILLSLLLSLVFTACSVGNNVEKTVTINDDSINKAVMNNVYLYSSTNGLHSTLDAWGSGSPLIELNNYEGYGKVYEIKSGNGWGAWTSCIAFTNLSNLQTNYDAVTFKIKSTNLSSIYVKIPSTDPNYAGANYKISSGKSLGNGWYELTVPFSAITGAASGQKELGIHGGWSNGGSFYITDVFLTPKAQYTLTWSDEFNNNGAVDTANKWSFEIGNGVNGWYNNELQYYTYSNAWTDSNGMLNIAAKKESAGGFAYTSTRMITKNKFSFKYGKIEVRAKSPKGKGLWPAIWMLGADSDTNYWPNCGEIDILEVLGHEPNKAYGTIHGPQYNGAGGIQNSVTLPTSFADAYHIFTVEWTDSKIEWFVDGVLFHQVTKANLQSWGYTWVFDKNFYLLINLAVGGNWPGNPDSSTIFPQTFQVDYIRVYQK